MQYIDHALSHGEIDELKKSYSPYAKVTVDLEKRTLVLGCELHADGEVILLEQGGKSDTIWGGGINFETKNIDATAVLNLRPGLGNMSMEILDPERRACFFEIVQEIFVEAL